jgi:hypothetical protein
MHSASLLVLGVQTSRFAGIRRRLPFVSGGDDQRDDAPASADRADGPDVAGTGTTPPRHGTEPTDASSGESRGRLDGIRHRLPLVPGPGAEADDAASPTDEATGGERASPEESESGGRLAGVRERLPFGSGSGEEPPVESPRSAEEWHDEPWRDDEDEGKSSLLTPGRLLAVGGALAGLGAGLLGYGLYKKRAGGGEPEEPTEEEPPVPETNQPSEGTRTLVGLAFMAGWSAVVKRLLGEDDGGQRRGDDAVAAGADDSRLE